MSRRRLGVRLGTTLAAAGVVAVVLAAGGWLFVVLVRGQLAGAVEAAARARAQDVAVLVSTDGVRGRLATTGEEAALVQVLGPTGLVLAATGNVEGEGPLIPTPAVRAPTSVTRAALPIGTAGQDFRVVALPVSLTEGPGWVLVASSLQPVERTVGRLAATLALTLPVLLLLVTAVIAAAVTRSLRPVERIRSRAAGLGAADLSLRVPVPAGRDAVARLAVTMNEMLGRLDAAARRQRQFVADASHELKSPLAALQAQIDVAVAYPHAQASDLTLRELREQTTRMGSLIDGLLFLARSDERGGSSGHGRVDLDELVLAEVRRLRLLGGMDVTVRGPAAAVVQGSPAELARLLRNLGDNAVAHARTSIAVGLGLDGGCAVLTVADDGPGVPVEDRERIFERFTRLDWERGPTGGGSGLGLSIVREIAVAHGGTVAMGGRDDGQGAVVTVRLPLGPVG